MNSRGFTLVEIIAIIVVLAAIFLISFPTFTNMAKADKEKEYSDMVENLCLAGETYIYSNIEEFSELSIVGSTINIPIEELINYGSVNKNTVNIKTNKTIEKDNLKYTVLDDYTLNCDYIYE